jgi:hypothetical protein
LLSKSDGLQCQTVPRNQKRPELGQHREQSRHHHSDANRLRRGSNAVDSRGDWSFDDAQAPRYSEIPSGYTLS